MRLYLQTARDEFRSFALFKEINPFELLFVPSGLTGAPTMTVRYPDRVIGDSELGRLEWNYSDGQPTNMPVDHFTCHRDGAIHLKKRGGDGPRYVETLKCDEPVTATSSRFLDVFVLADRAVEYGVISERPKSPRIIIVTHACEVVFIRARFAGLDYDLEAEVDTEAKDLHDTPNVVPRHTIAWSTIKGILTIQKSTFPPEVFRNRPKGTLVTTQFNVAADRHLIRAFGFA